MEFKRAIECSGGRVGRVGLTRGTAAGQMTRGVEGGIDQR